jgi:PAS domain S-box-containing protein
MSMNEELQSANEELESSKEELQSLNEELTTVNNQLEAKVNELDAANNDLSNLTAATEIAIVFLDPERHIRRFTSPAARVLKLLPGDLGRPFDYLAPSLIGDALTDDARRVVSTGTPIEREVLSSDGRWYLRRILPYHGDEGTAGTVIAFIDISQRVQAEAQARRLAAVLRDSSDAIAVMDLERRITAWNRGAETLYGYSEAQAEDDARGPCNSGGSRSSPRCRQTGPAGEVVAAFETQRRSSDGRVLDVWATVTLVRDESGKPSILAMTERDITERRRAEQQVRTLNAQLEQRVAKRTHELQLSEERMAAILGATSEAIVTIDSNGKIVTFNRAAVRVFGYSAEEAVGQNVRLLMPPSERERHDGYLARYLKTREPHILGRTRALSACRKDGALFPIQLTVAEVGDLKLFVGCIRDMTDARALQEEVLNIAMLEQRRIGQELHDGTQQELTGLGLLAQNLNEKLSQQGAKADAELAGRIAAAIAEANRHVRQLARGLIPVPIDAESLPAALAELAQSTQQSYALTCRFEAPKPVKVADAGAATHLYRIAQEAVGNAVKHAKADAVSVRLAPTEGELTLEIADNGIGIDLQKRTQGVGLRLMEHRCAVIGGRFSVQVREGGGTVVQCILPSRSGLT